MIVRQSPGDRQAVIRCLSFNSHEIISQWSGGPQAVVKRLLSGGLQVVVRWSSGDHPAQEVIIECQSYVR